jgi:hypothetical protein
MCLLQSPVVLVAVVDPSIRFKGSWVNVMNIKYVALSILLFVSPGHSFVFAADGTKSTIAIAPFDTRNCDITLSRSMSQKAEQSIVGRAAGTGVVIADQNARGYFALFGAELPSDALFFEKLSDNAPDCVLVGRVEGSPDNRGDNPNSKYRIIVRLLGSRSEGSLINYTSDWMQSSEFDRAADILSEKIIARIDVLQKIKVGKAAATQSKESSSTKWFPYLSLFGCAPTGSFASVAKGGFGINAGVGINDLSFPLLHVDRVVFRGGAGVYAFSPNKSSVKSITLVPVTVGIGRSFLFDMFSVTPLADVGLLVGIMKRTDVQLADGRTGYKTGAYADPLVSFSVECSKKLSGAVISVAPFYSVFFEKGNTGQFAGVSFGAGYNM